MNCILEMIKPYIELLVALGTIATAVLAYYFGFYGNYETKLLLKRKENEMDKEAFSFLKNMIKKIFLRDPDGSDKISAEEYISEFEEKVLSACYISPKKIKEYNKYLGLAREIMEYPANSDGSGCKERREIFNQIKAAAEKFENKVTHESWLQGKYILQEYQDNFSEKVVFCVKPHRKDRNHPIALIYTDRVGGRDKARELINSKVKEIKGLEEGDEVYTSEELSICCKLKEYYAIKENDKQIEIRYKNKSIPLCYNVPYLL
jgi:hypothetical protein